MKSTAWLRVGVLLILIVVALVSSLVALLWGNQEWDGLALNFGTEMAGALVTYGLLELVIRRREEREARKEEREAKKADLIAQMGSSVKDVAIAAAEELRRRGWLRDGSLTGATLARANLQGANLGGANLQGTNLSVANLQRAILSGANLQGAFLVGASLQGATLARANLQGADLFMANLQGAMLLGANLREAVLNEVTLPVAQSGHRTPIWPASQTISILISGVLMHSSFDIRKRLFTPSKRAALIPGQLCFWLTSQGCAIWLLMCSSALNRIKGDN